MKRERRTPGLPALLMVAALLPAGWLSAHEGHLHKVMGTVAAVDAEHLTVATQDGTKVEIALNKDTKFLRGTSSCGAADIKTGERVVVMTMEHEGRKTAHEVRLASAEKAPN